MCACEDVWDRVRDKNKIYVTSSRHSFISVITSIKLPGARYILMKNMMGIQITEQMTMSQPITMDQVG